MLILIYNDAISETEPETNQTSNILLHVQGESNPDFGAGTGSDRGRVRTSNKAATNNNNNNNSSKRGNRKSQRKNADEPEELDRCE